jgi:hypothetical protein
VPLSQAIAAVTRTQAAPPKLVGRWTRAVTAADVQRDRKT